MIGGGGSPEDGNLLANQLRGKAEVDLTNLNFLAGNFKIEAFWSRP
jgi:hypothetical protein